MTVKEQLLALADPAYAAFEAKLTPTLPKEAFLGVRVPVLRKFAAEFRKTPACDEFLHTLPHTSYDENLLHSVLLEKQKDYDACITLVEAFLPYVDNWAVCDTLRPAVFAKHRKDVLPKIREWIMSPATYTCRFGMDMLMTHFLDSDFREEYLAYPAAVQSEEYYVNMMAAWYYATALAKQWDATLPYLTENKLSLWVHNKTIQKACESYRVSPEQKEFLKTLKR